MDNTGLNVRDWLYVDDHAKALVHIMNSGAPGRSYNVGGNEERTNMQVVETVCTVLDKLKPAADGGSYLGLVEQLSDRPGHDHRYAIDARRIKAELKWGPAETFESGIRKTVQWYLDNQQWVKKVQGDSYDGSRSGTGKGAKT